jgi:hypothetical protein
MNKFSNSEIERRYWQADKLSRQMRYDYPRKAQTYFDSLVEEAQIKQLGTQPWKEFITWLQSQDPSSDARYSQFLESAQHLAQEPVFPQPDEYENWFDKEILEFYINNNDEVRLQETLMKHDIPYDLVQSQTGKKILVIEVGETKFMGQTVPELWIVEKQEDGTLNYWQSSSEWIEHSSEYPDDYLTLPDFSEQFWQDVGPGSVAYHATTAANLESILAHGLEARDDTRGLSNRDMGPAVFTVTGSDDIETQLEAYGEVVIRIDLDAMKRDKYMPTASTETPLENAEIKNTLARLIGEDYYEAETGSDYMSDTIAFYGNIPPKYLSIWKQANTKQVIKRKPPGLSYE